MFAGGAGVGSVGSVGRRGRDAGSSRQRTCAGRRKRQRRGSEAVAQCSHCGTKAKAMAKAKTEPEPHPAGQCVGAQLYLRLAAAVDGGEFPAGGRQSGHRRLGQSPRRHGQRGEEAAVHRVAAKPRRPAAVRCGLSPLDVEVCSVRVCVFTAGGGGDVSTVECRKEMRRRIRLLESRRERLRLQIGQQRTANVATREVCGAPARRCACGLTALTWLAVRTAVDGTRPSMSCGASACRTTWRC